jgi:hypothetical protein
MVKYWNSRHTVCWRAALQFRLVKPSVIYLPFCWYYSHKWIYEQIRIILHYCSYGKWNMWLEKITTWSTWLATRNQTLKSPTYLAMLRPILIRHCPWHQHHGSHSTKDGLEVSCVSNDHSAISPAHWMLEFGERWRKHLGHSAKTEKEQYQRMETTSSTECLWTRCGRNALMTIVATSAVFGDSFFSRCGNLMSRWECWWSWGPEPKVLRKLSDTWMFPKTRVPQIFGFSDQGWMMLFLLVISGESG